MPTNNLRSQAARLLARALEAQENARTAEAHELTIKAVQCLEDAMSVEQLRGASPRRNRSDTSLPVDQMDCADIPRA